MLCPGLRLIFRIAKQVSPVGGCRVQLGSLWSLANLYCMILFDVLLGCWPICHQQLVISSSSCWWRTCQHPNTWWCGVSDCSAIFYFRIVCHILRFFRRVVHPVESRISPHINEPRLIFFCELFGESALSLGRAFQAKKEFGHHHKCYLHLLIILIRDLENSQIPPKHLQVSDFVFILRILNPIFARVERMNWNL